MVNETVKKKMGLQRSILHLSPFRSQVNTVTVTIISMGQFWLNKVGEVRKFSENSSY